MCRIYTDYGPLKKSRGEFQAKKPFLESIFRRFCSQFYPPDPYAVLRHPGYTGVMIYNLATPVLLGSGWALAVGMAVTVLLAIRTSLEDATLRAELPGYVEYAAIVRYRLVPFVW